MRRDDLIVRGDEGEVVEEAGGPQVLDGGPPAARVVGPLEPEHLPRQNLGHGLKCSNRMQLRKNKMPPIIKKFAMNHKIFIVTRFNLQVLVVLGQGGVLGLLDVLLDLALPGGVHGDLWRHQGGHRHELQVGVADQLPELRVSMNRQIKEE